MTNLRARLFRVFLGEMSSGVAVTKLTQITVCNFDKSKTVVIFFFVNVVVPQIEEYSIADRFFPHCSQKLSVWQSKFETVVFLKDNFFAGCLLLKLFVLLDGARDENLLG